MRYVVVALALTVCACAQPQMDALTYSHEMYIGCLRGHPPEECQSQRAAFDANRGYTDSVSRRAIARPPLVFDPYIPAPAPVHQPIVTCTRAGTLLMCD